jgi:phosphosulfolactate phosphohydrolase-like enzyme
MCCAWIAEGLVNAGYRPRGEWTAKLVERWSNAPVDAFLNSKSVEYLTRTGQQSDLDFILAHIDDVSDVFALKHDQIIGMPA